MIMVFNVMTFSIQINIDKYSSTCLTEEISPEFVTILQQG